MNGVFFVSLMYHNVVPEQAAGNDESWQRRLSPSITNYFVTGETFARHMQRLAESAACLGSTDVAAFFHSREDAPSWPETQPLVAVTFDDGWRGCVENGGPILAQHGWKATLFVTTELIGRPGFLTRAELQELSPDLFEIGSHGVTHGFLNEQPDASVRRELHDSRRELEDLLGRAVEMVSIPNGAVDDRVLEIAEDVGYRLVFTSDIHRNTRRTGPLHIGRLPVCRSTTPAQVAAFARGEFGVQQWRRSLLQIPKRLLGRRGYRQVRRTLLGDDGNLLEMQHLASASTDDRPPR